MDEAVTVASSNEGATAGINVPNVAKRIYVAAKTATIPAPQARIPGCQLGEYSNSIASSNVQIPRNDCG